MAFTISRGTVLPAVLAMAAGLGLSSVGALPTPALAAAPVIAGVPRPPDRQEQLQKALITEKDVPAGHVEQATGGFAETLAAMLVTSGFGSSPCDLGSAVSSLAATGPSRTSGDPGPGTPPGTDPSPPPVRTDPPPSPVAGPDQPDVLPIASAFFVHDRTGAVALEALAAPGADLAVQAVDQIQEILDECPQIEAGTLKITTQPLRWNPPFGDESITVTMDLQARLFGVDLSAHLKVAQVAYRDVSLTVGLIGADDPKHREFKQVTRAAIRKLVAGYGVQAV